MSRIGKMPIQVPAGVTVDIDGRDVTVTGPKGALSHTLVEPITVERGEDGTLFVRRPDDARESKSRHGLTRTGREQAGSGRAVDGLVGVREPLLEPVERMDGALDREVGDFDLGGLQ